jgi:hypothetical protein
MERFCVQPVKVPFNSIVYRGSEMIMNIPKLADAVGAIRLVLDEPTPFLEEIIQEAELLGIEKLWGEFIRIENDLKVSIEKAEYRSSRIIPIPFYCLTDFYFDPLTLRILFLGGGDGQEIHGHLLIDYVTTSGLPKTPYFKRIRTVSMIKAPMNNSKRLTLDVYIPGAVYEIFFTVRDNSGNFIECIENVTLLMDDRERFNCSGDHLHYIEPLKRYGSYASNVYMYSFSLGGADELRVPSGQTCLSEKQRFIIDTWSQTGTLTIWACSRNFVYNNKRVFDSYELALNCVQGTGSLSPVPVRTSSIVSNDTLTVIYTSNVSLTTPVGPYQVLGQSGRITFSSPGFSNTVCAYNIRTDWLGPPQLYDMFCTGKPRVLIDGNNRLFLSDYQSCMDQYANFFTLQGTTLVKSRYNGTLVYSVPGVSCLPGVYFGFEAIPLLSGGIQTTNGTIPTSFAADSIVVDSSNVYVAYQNAYYVYDQIQLKRIDSKFVSPVCTSPSLIGLTRSGPVLCLSTGDVYQFGTKTWHVTNSHGGTLYKMFISDYDDVFVSYVDVADFYIYKVGTPYFKKYSGAWAYDISFSGSIFLVGFSALPLYPVVVTEEVSHEYGKTIKGGSTYFIQLNINLQYNSTDQIVQYNTRFNPYENPKYDASYFAANIIGQELSFVNSYLWNNYVVCNITIGTTFSLSCDTLGENVYSALRTDSTASSIYGTHGEYDVHVPSTIGFSAVLISMNTYTSNVQWVAVIDGLGAEDTQRTVASLSNVYICGSYGPQSSNVYNSNHVVSRVLPPGSQIGAYLVKYSSTGDVLWASYCSATDSPITMSGVSHANGVTTCFVSQIQGSAGTITIRDATFASSRVFYVTRNFGSLIQYGSTGNYIRSIYFQSSWISEGQVLSVNSNVYCSFQKGPEALTIDSVTRFPFIYGGVYNSHCIVKFSSILQSYYGMMISSENLLYVGGISVDSNENVYASGFWRTSGRGVYVYDSSGITTRLLIPKNNSSYVMKFNSSGRYAWTSLFYSTTGIETTQFTRGNASSVDGTSLFVAGNYDGTSTTNYIRNGDGTPGIPIFVTPTSSSRDAILIRFTSDTGRSMWYLTVSGMSYDGGVSVTTDSSGYVYFSGYYTGEGVVIRDGMGSVYNTYRPVSLATQVAFHIKISGLNGSLVTVT